MLLPGIAAAAEGPGRFGIAVEDQVINVSPVVINRTVQAGSATELEVTVANQTARAFDFSTSLADIAPGRTADDDKEIVEAGTTPLSASVWTHVDPASFHLDAWQERHLRVRVAPPEGTAPGGRYAALVIEVEPPAGGQVAIAAQVHVLLLLTVDGEVERDLRITVAPRRRLYWRGARVTWRVTAENRGNVHEPMAGRLVARGLFGSERSVAGTSVIVLPGATRRFDVSMSVRDAPDLLGGEWRYRLGEARRVHARSGGRVIVMPWWVLVVVLAAALMVVWRLRARGR